MVQKAQLYMELCTAIAHMKGTEKAVEQDCMNNL